MLSSKVCVAPVHEADRQLDIGAGVAVARLHQLDQTPVVKVGQAEERHDLF
jgi:hypothetical protein